MSVKRVSCVAVDLVAFDMGGTTVRDEGVVPHVFREALQPLGIAVRHENDHGEFHILASAVDYRGRTVGDSKDFERSEEIAKELKPAAHFKKPLKLQDFLQIVQTHCPGVHA